MRRAALAEAGSFAELREALDAEKDRIGALEADGWELVSFPGQMWGTTAQFLVDTRRPDEHFTARDQP